MIRVKASSPDHRSREEELQERLMIRSWNVGEGRVHTIEQVPLDVGLGFSQPPLPQRGGAIATSDPLEGPACD